MNIGNQKYFLLLIYKPSRVDKLAFITQLDLVLELLTVKCNRIIVCGDFNINTLKDDVATSEYKNAISGNGFDICIHVLTRIGENSESCLDHFFRT